jgi:NAD+ diphosphatase
MSRTHTFAGLGQVLDRYAERRDQPGWVAAQAASAQSRYLVIDGAGETWLLPEVDRLCWLDAAARQECFPEVSPSLLGIADGLAYFLLAPERAVDQLPCAPGARRIGLREAGQCLEATEAGLFAYAKGLAHWQRETRHCARCGAPLQLLSAGHRGQCTAADCGRLHFPRTDAAIIVIVEHDGACLLGRQAGWPAGRWSTLAGFVEPGESLEDAVRREVAEEAGVVVDQVHYHSSQPWPLPASLMVGFTATARSRAIHLRDGELEDARWFTPADIAQGLADGSFATPTPLSVSYHLLAHWLRHSAGVDLLTAADSTSPAVARPSP